MNPPRETTRDPRANDPKFEKSFVFDNSALTHAQKVACEHISETARGMATEIAAMVPDGQHRLLALSYVMGAVRFARHGIIKAPEAKVIPCCERDTDHDGNCDRHPA